MNIPLICAHLDETTDDAIARHVAKHGPLPDNEGNPTVTTGIVLIPVAPALQDAARVH